MLAPAEQALLRCLAVFVGGFTLEAAEALISGVAWSAAGHDAVHPDDTLDGITSLVDHSLLRQCSGFGNTVRYQMLETVREYAAEHLQTTVAFSGGSQHCFRRRNMKPWRTT